MPVAAILRRFFSLASPASFHPHDTIVGCTEFRHGQTHPSTVLPPFQIVRAFGVSFRLAVDYHQIGLDTPIRRQADRAIAQALGVLTRLMRFTSLALGLRQR